MPIPTPLHFILSAGYCLQVERLIHKFATVVVVFALALRKTCADGIGLRAPFSKRLLIEEGYSAIGLQINATVELYRGTHLIAAVPTLG